MTDFGEEGRYYAAKPASHLLTVENQFSLDIEQMIMSSLMGDQAGGMFGGVAQNMWLGHAVALPMVYGPGLVVRAAQTAVHVQKVLEHRLLDELFSTFPSMRATMAVNQSTGHETGSHPMHERSEEVYGTKENPGRGREALAGSMGAFAIILDPPNPRDESPRYPFQGARMGFIVSDGADLNRVVTASEYLQWCENVNLKERVAKSVGPLDDLGLVAIRENELCAEAAKGMAKNLGVLAKYNAQLGGDDLEFVLGGWVR